MQFKKYINSNLNISISFPYDWSLLNIKNMVFCAVKPKENGIEFRENINLAMELLESETDLNQYVTVSLLNLQKYLDKFKHLETTYIIFGKNDFARTVYIHYTHETFLKVIYYQTVKNNMVYNITCSTTENQYDKYLTVFQEIVNTLDLGQ